MLINQLLEKFNLTTIVVAIKSEDIIAEIITKKLVLATQLTIALNELCHLPMIVLDELSSDVIKIDLLPEIFIRTYQILPFVNEQQQLSIALANPAIKELAFINFWLAQSVNWYVTDYDKLAEFLAYLLHDQAQQQLTSEASITPYVEQLFIDAFTKRASDIHIENYAKKVRIRLRIDGLLYEQALLDGEWSQRLSSHLKVLAQLDITERRLPQDGRLLINLPMQKTLDCRFNTCPMVNDGEKAVLRLLNSETTALTIDQLGFTLEQKQLFHTAIQQPQGMVLVTGPTGSGKTITLYGALQFLNQTKVNIASIEDPVEIILTGINQVPVNAKIDLTFAKVLRALLRQDPDIIMVGEMRDVETSSLALQAAQTGHLVLSTLHTNSAVETLTRLLQMGIASYQLAASVTLIIAQRLIRLLCPHCKIKDQAVSELANNLIYQAIGCKQCQNGYRGRTAIYECLPITPAIKQAILQTTIINNLQTLAVESGMLSLHAHGWQKVLAGLTTPAELARVLPHYV